MGYVFAAHKPLPVRVNEKGTLKRAKKEERVLRSSRVHPSLGKGLEGITLGGTCASGHGDRVLGVCQQAGQAVQALADTLPDLHGLRVSYNFV